ncbi:hypothetical protein ACJU26_11310 [Acidithiobacillus sp. M4-SHS-6]|uniref:hypothetical protein n=1 Tax=Acidithiobacillus sp. M4-SHS-6 TaxID=3383024 RepID=UPI0039BEA7E7
MVIVTISLYEFNTAVGLVMQHAQSGNGWIAAAQTTSHMSTSSSSDFFTSTVTHKETANTKPVWTAVLPEGAAPGEQASYLLPVPDTYEGSQQAVVAAHEVDQEQDPQLQTGRQTAERLLGTTPWDLLVRLHRGTNYPITMVTGGGHSRPAWGITAFLGLFVMHGPLALCCPLLFRKIWIHEAPKCGTTNMEIQLWNIIR